MIHKEEIPDSPLFAGIHPEEKESILKCLSAVEKKYEKATRSFLAGTAIRSMGFILSGSVDILPGRFLGKQAGPWTCWERRALRRGLCLYAWRVSDGKCGGGGEVPDPVSGHRKDPKRLHPACSHHNRLIHNLLYIMAKKNLMLDAEDRPHGTEVHPGKGDGVPIL